MGSIRRFALRLLTLVRAGRAETDLVREIDAHLQLLEDAFVARGLSAREARDAARRAFGGVEQVKERQRDERSFRVLAGWTTDLKLGARMLVRSPGLTIVGVAALAVAIGAGAAYMEFITDMFDPALPLPQAERLVGILDRDVARGDPEPRLLRDFVVWRAEVRSVQDLGAYVPLARNLVTDDGRGEPVDGVEISASAFRVAATPPLLGRPLVESDEAPGAPPVVVMGEALWRTRLGGDPAVIGRTVRLGNVPHTIVGIMPASFGFPVRQRLWVPLRLDTAALRRSEGPRARCFGRLAPGMPLETAQAEFDAIGARVNAANPATSELRPQVVPYMKSFWTSRAGRLQLTLAFLANVFFIGLLAVCGANVATLVFARTATRQGEITVRTALGASRSRIVAQLFAEALVLSLLAAVVGLFGARYGVERIKETFLVAQDMTSMPFWWNDALSPTTIVYASVLALGAAALTGVVPALKATGPEMQGRLKEASAGASMRLGGIWTAIIVGQVALTVVFFAALIALGWSLRPAAGSMQRFAFQPGEFVAFELQFDQRTKVDAIYEALDRRLSAEPGVAGVTYNNVVPGRGVEYFLEIDPSPRLGHDSAGPARVAIGNADHPLRVKCAEVAPDYFQTLGTPILAGRGFTEGDIERSVAIVDRAFVDYIFGGHDPIGLRVRQPRQKDRPAGPWMEIVGVVKELSTFGGKTAEDSILYRPRTAAAVQPFRVLVRAGGDAAPVATAVRRAAAATDPTLRVYSVMSLDHVEDADRQAERFFTIVIGLVGAVALLLATAGIYALMTFTVARRTREIGVRVALGAAPHRIVTGIFSETFRQVGLGILIGSIPGGALLAVGLAAAGGGDARLMIGGTIGSAVFILIVAMLACVIPVRRALSIQPIEALRADA